MEQRFLIRLGWRRWVVVRSWQEEAIKKITKAKIKATEKISTVILFATIKVKERKIWKTSLGKRKNWVWEKEKRGRNYLTAEIVRKKAKVIRIQ
jgi:hypothetical protein